VPSRWWLPAPVHNLEFFGLCAGLTPPPPPPLRSAKLRLSQDSLKPRLALSPDQQPKPVFLIEPARFSRPRSAAGLL